MQRLIDLFRQQTIGFHRQEDIGGFNADFKLIEVQTIEMIDMTHGGFEQRLRRRLAIFFLQIFFQRAGVDADADRDVFIASAIYNHADALFVADVARVDTQAVDAIFRHFQRNTVVKVDIGDQRDVNLLFDKFERLSSVHRRNRDTDNVRAYAL